jgi:hypothetical protein
MKLPAATLGGISVSFQEAAGYSGKGESTTTRKTDGLNLSVYFGGQRKKHVHALIVAFAVGYKAPGFLKK